MAFPRNIRARVRLFLVLCRFLRSRCILNAHSIFLEAEERVQHFSPFHTSCQLFVGLTSRSVPHSVCLISRCFCRASGIDPPRHKHNLKTRKCPRPHGNRRGGNLAIMAQMRDKRIWKRNAS
ncbi:hypothetical protein BJ875DRAFT_261689 [Amylocarpus encephaloides]|uniref:Secreted protein n=1 Tax=Amylocarpus encephaloides TaxID=45428 RepID=A0A9P7YSN9_9HELO|nr:hypothetical protein BJ875DRAFT_261689 [Amylocarpus encephaloides]